MPIHDTRRSRRLPAGRLLLGASLLLFAPAVRGTAADFLRGDVNGDGVVSISDPGFLDHYLFLGGLVPSCIEAGDADDSGEVNLTDSVRILDFLFQGGDELCDPFPAPGADPTPDRLTCDVYGGGAPLDDPGARLELDDAVVDSEGNATIAVRVSSSREIKGLSAAIAVGGDIFGNTGRTTIVDLSSGTRSGGYLAARVEGERLLIGTLFSLTEHLHLPPGQDVPVLEVTTCVDAGTPAGRYPLVLEAGELVDGDTGRAIHPALSGSVLEVPAGMAPQAGCASQEEGSRSKCSPEVPAECPDPDIGPPFLRGDANADGWVSVADAGFIEAYVSGNGPAPTCLKAADADDSGTVDLDDSVAILEWRVEGGPDLCPPFQVAGDDPTPDGLSCDAYTQVWPLVDQVDKLRLADARVAADGTFSLKVHVTNSTPIAGYGGSASIGEILPNGVYYTAHDLTGARDPYVSAAVRDQHLNFGFLASRTGEAVLPPGEDRPVLEIRGCVTKGAHLGYYPFNLSHAELVDGDTHESAYAVHVEGGIIVPDEMGSGGCEDLYQPREPGCAQAATGPDVPFRRGDANADGRLSISDVAMIRGFLFDDGRYPTCLDAADADDSGETRIADMLHTLRYLFLGEGDIPPPHGDPGVDPTADGLSCLRYTVSPPVETADVLRIGDAEASPGASVDIPVFLTNCRAIEAVQLLVQYDPAAFSPEEVSFERSEMPRAEFASVRPGPINGVFTLAVFPRFTDSFDSFAVKPGADQLIFRIHGTVSPDAPPGTQIVLLPTDGPDGQGLGPERLRNEITYRGHARYASFLPRFKPGILNIVPDVAIFRRGDSNRDEAIDLSDAQHTLSWLFLGDEKPPCLDAADANDDGTVDMSDPIWLLGFLFLGTNSLPQPHPEAGVDPSADGLGCAEREG